MACDSKGDHRISIDQSEDTVTQLAAAFSLPVLSFPWQADQIRRPWWIVNGLLPTAWVAIPLGRSEH